MGVIFKRKQWGTANMIDERALKEKKKKKGNYFNKSLLTDVTPDSFLCQVLSLSSHISADQWKYLNSY